MQGTLASYSYTRYSEFVQPVGKALTADFGSHTQARSLSTMSKNNDGKASADHAV